MTQIRLAASDMDGTLLNAHHRLSEYTKETLYLLAAKGIPFIFATGRHYNSTTDFITAWLDYVKQREEQDQVKKCNLEQFYVISSNGARIHSPFGELIAAYDLDSDIVKDLYETFSLPYTKNAYGGSAGSSEGPPESSLPLHEDGEAVSEGVSTSAYTTDQWYITAPFLPPEVMAEKFGVKPYLVPFDKNAEQNKGRHVFMDFPTEGVGKVCFRSWDRALLNQFEADINEKYGDRVTVCFSSNFCLDVMTKTVSKAAGIKSVCELLNKNFSEEKKVGMQNVVSFGDSMNDCEMLRQTGRGFLVRNAQERLVEALPDNDIIGHHDEDSVARKLRELFHLEV